MEGARVSLGSSGELREPVALMLREKSSGTHEDESTDARHRGGRVRSSDEAAVMAVERRGSVRQSTLIIN